MGTWAGPEHAPSGARKEAWLAEPTQGQVMELDSYGKFSRGLCKRGGLEEQEGQDSQRLLHLSSDSSWSQEAQSLETVL